METAKQEKQYMILEEGDNRGPITLFACRDEGEEWTRLGWRSGQDDATGYILADYLYSNRRSADSYDMVNTWKVGDSTDLYSKTQIYDMLEELFEQLSDPDNDFVRIEDREADVAIWQADDYYTPNGDVMSLIEQMIRAGSSADEIGDAVEALPDDMDEILVVGLREWVQGMIDDGDLDDN